MNSKAKGKRGELDLTHKLRELGFDCRRSQQYCGSEDSADVVGIQGLHIECKRDERLNVENAMQQAESDCGVGAFPVVMHRKNGEKWKATIRLDDFMEIYKVYVNGK